MYRIIKAGGFTNGGLNFDSKARRGSNTYEDMFLAHIAGMDAFALGLINAYKLIEDGRLDKFVEDRYASYNSGIGADIVSGKATLEDLAAYARTLKGDLIPASGKQEYLESVLNSVIFG
jgi:xylose isomerase